MTELSDTHIDSPVGSLLAAGSVSCVDGPRLARVDLGDF